MKRMTRAFLEGMASIALFPEPRRARFVMDTRDGFTRDAEALRGDWIAVGNDLRNAMDTYKNEFEGK
jgi:hypothetical protein